MNRHFCNEDCRRANQYGYNCRMGQNNYDKRDPPWQENGFWGGGIEPNEADLGRIACHSANYRDGWDQADRLLSGK